MPDAGTIRSSVRLELKQLRADLQTLDTLLKTGADSVKTFSEKTSAYITELSTRNKRAYKTSY